MHLRRAADAHRKDEASKKELTEKERKLQSATAALNTAEAQRANLGRAMEALASLIRDYSLDGATKEAFQAIRDLIDDVFSRIHTPNEYLLGDFEDGGLLVGKLDGQERDANQVSTGQRAALALSMFLALNESAETAPPVLLIDDPVAHVDDLNSMAFIDYLREIALTKRKQIFFATADARLAALFQRKFEFLGNRRFGRIALPISQVERK